MPRVTKRVRAEQDLDEIWLYIAENNLVAADTLIDTIAGRCQMLAKQPLAGRARSELAPELRSYAVQRYIVFYLPLPDGIDVVRVLHSARDIAALAGSGGFDD